MKVAVFLAQGFEEMEALVTVDVLRRAKFDVTTVSIQSERLVEGGHGIPVLADITFEEGDWVQTDLLILPGGMPGTNHLQAHEGLRVLLIAHSSEKKWIGAICAAPRILGKLGLLKGQFATCYPGYEEDLEGAILVDEKVVVSSHFITGKGAGASLDFALKMVELFIDYETAQDLRTSMIAD